MTAPIFVGSIWLLYHVFVAARTAALEMSRPVNTFPTILNTP